MNMSSPDIEVRTQNVACFLILISLIAVAFADKCNWRDLASAGNTVMGFGGGILTGKYLTQSANAGGKIINPAPNSTEAS